MIKIYFFGSLREQLNTAEINLSENDLAIDKPSTIGELRQLLQQKSTAWQLALADNNVLFAVNQLLACENTRVNDGDEIAFFPPVTGG